MSKEDEYRPWMINLWFAMEPGSVLNTPQSGSKIELISFPPRELEPTPPPPNNPASASPHHDKRRKIANFVKIESIDVLNVNLTPSAYKVIMYLTKLTTGDEKEAFVEDKPKPLLHLCNFLGLRLTIFMDEAHKVDKSLIAHYNVDLRQDNVTGKRIRNLEKPDTIIEEPPSDTSVTLASLQTEKEADSVKYKLILACEGFHSKVISFKTDGCFLVSLRANSRNAAVVDLAKMKLDKDNTEIMYRVKTNYGRQKIVFSSPMQIENASRSTLSIVIRLYDRDAAKDWPNETKTFDRHVVDNVIVDEEGEPLNEQQVTLGVLFKLKPGGVYYVPIRYAYAKTLYVTPNLSVYLPGKVYGRADGDRVFSLGKYSQLIMSQLASEGSDGQDFYLLKQSLVNVKRPGANLFSQGDVNYRIVLINPVILFNVLPFKIRLDVFVAGKEDKLEMQPGQSITIHASKDFLDNCKIHVGNYSALDWFGSLDIKRLLAAESAGGAGGEMESKNVIDMSIAPSCVPDGKTVKYLHIHWNVKKPNEITLFSPYWIVNKTGQNLQIRVRF